MEPSNVMPFVVRHNRLLWAPFGTTDSRKWLMTLGYSSKDWETSVRGYIADGEVQFFTGADYHQVNVINDTLLSEVKTKHSALFGRRPERVYNGLTIGVAGVLGTPMEQLQ